MTLAERKAVRERCDAATDGPWEYYERSPWVRIGGADRGYDVCGWDLSTRTNPPLGEDGQFIAHARTDLPMALDEIERLEKVIEKLQVGLAQSYLRDEAAQAI